jgi:transporter family protein
MKTWFILGLAASFIYGISAIFFKLLTSSRYLGGHPGWVLTGIGAGIVLCGLFGILFWPGATLGGTTLKACLLAMPAGFLNGFATLLVLWLLNQPSTNISQLVPVYNTNTLVAFILAVIIFRELPQGMDLVRNLAGAVLIVAGTVLIVAGTVLIGK